MSKIYQRDRLVSNVKPKKFENSRRTRSALLNFWITPEERSLIEDRIKLSGLSKQEFFIQSCMHQRIITFGNVKTFDLIKKKLDVTAEYLSKIQRADELELEVLESLRTILEILDGVGKEDSVENQIK